MLILTSIMLHYAHSGNCIYYAQNYAGIICQGLFTIQTSQDVHISFFSQTRIKATCSQSIVLRSGIQVTLLEAAKDILPFRVLELKCALG